MIGSDGMTAGEALPELNQEVGAHSSGDYHNVETGSAGARRDTLPQIEQAVDDGKPVVLSAHDDSGGHAMVIVGHQGDMLEIYNPWGYTVWVSEDGFVVGHLDLMDQGVPSTPVSVRIPS